MSAQIAEEPAFDPRLPFSRAQARAAGITMKELIGPRYQKVLYDSYVSRVIPITMRMQAEAAIRIARPGSRVSHHTAAKLWGGVVPPDDSVHITVPTTGARLIRKGIVSHCSGGSRRFALRHGLPVSTPMQTFFELAAWGLDLVDLVVLADAFIKARRFTLDALRAEAKTYDGRRRAVAGRAADLAREHVDSLMETRLRLLIVLAGLPEPQINLIVRGADGEWERRYDLVYPGLRLIVEYDGRQHAQDSKQWVTDIHRREELDRLGWRLIIITSEGIYREPLRTLERIRRALLECGSPHVRRRYRDEWRMHFPTLERLPLR